MNTLVVMTLKEIVRTHSNSSTPSPELLLCPLTISPSAPSLSAEDSSGSLPVEPHWTPADRKSVY